jgi:hypothetical protein
MPVADCRMPIDGLPIAECRLTNCRLLTGAPPINNRQSVDHHSAIYNPSIVTRHSAIRRSSIDSRQYQSPIGNRQSPILSSHPHDQAGRASQSMPGSPIGAPGGASGVVIGVAADAKYQDVHTAAPPTMYFPYRPRIGTPGEFTLRTSVPPASIAADVQHAVDNVMKGARIRKLTTLADQVNAAIVPERLLALLSGFFGVLGAVLAATGLYGLIAYTVARRTREIGVRMALGATRADISRMVLVDALRLVVAGLMAGVPAAFWGQRVAATMLENMPAGGWWPMLAAALGMIAVTVVAASIPARRATRVSPVTALRVE